MNARDTNNKKYKRPKQKTLSTTNPDPTKPNYVVKSRAPPLCPLLAKDSEWVDILQTAPVTGEASSSASTISTIQEEEAVLQLVDCEDGPQMKPLAIMFPDLIQKDPQTLEGVINKVMSTTEVTKHLVDLGQKANFTCMKKSNRLIPRDKQWLEKVTEDNNSSCSLNSYFYNSSVPSDYEADTEVADDESGHTTRRRRRKTTSDMPRRIADYGSQDTLPSIEQAPQQSIQERPHQDQLNATTANRAAPTSNRSRKRHKQDHKATRSSRH